MVATIGAILFGALGHVVGFRSAQERNKWRIDALEKKMDEHETRMEDLRRQTQHYDGTLKVIETVLDQIKKSIDGLRDDLKGKADK